MGEEAGRKAKGTLSKAASYALIALLCVPLAIGCYALRDSHTVYERAGAER